MNNLKQYEIDEIEKFLMLDCELDDEIFNYYFINLGSNIKQVYKDYVTLENNLYNNFNVATYKEFKKATELKLEDRFYTEINRYIKFSDNCIYYINDNTLLG